MTLLGEMAVLASYYPITGYLGVVWACAPGVPLPTPDNQILNATVACPGSQFVATFVGRPWTSGTVSPTYSWTASGSDARDPDGLGTLELVTATYFDFVPPEALRASGFAVGRLTIQYLALDSDGDGVAEGDNCPVISNAGQEDADGDGNGDACDNCPWTPNLDQLDRGGVAGTTPDGIGDVCQNGDFNGDGTVDIADIVLLRQVVAGEAAPFQPTMPPGP